MGFVIPENSGTRNFGFGFGYFGFGYFGFGFWVTGFLPSPIKENKKHVKVKNAYAQEV
jgi:hypothetical protein